jgi:DNA-binding response OmpR family regulator
MAQYRLLAIDDDEDCADLIVRVAVKCGYEGLPITNADSLVDAVAMWRPDVVTLDIGMPNVDGADAVALLADVKFKGQVIIVSGKPDWQRKLVADLGLRLGLAIAGNEQKPVDILRLRRLLLGISRRLETVGDLAQRQHLG